MTPPDKSTYNTISSRNLVLCVATLSSLGGFRVRISRLQDSCIILRLQPPRNYHHSRLATHQKTNPRVESDCTSQNDKEQGTRQDGATTAHCYVCVIALRHIQGAFPMVCEQAQLTFYSGRVYVRNLEERGVNIEVLKEALRTIFSEYGNIIDIVAKTNLKAKGQAFVVFEDPQSALKAIEEVQGFELYKKEMHLSLARTQSDATVLKTGNEEEFDIHKRRRMAEKGMLC